MDYKLIKNRLGEVVVTQALETSKADFLATHLPFRNLKIESRGLKTIESGQLSEEDYFREYIMGTRDDHNFIIIKGDNGTGKSHLIRWLYYKYENEIDLNEEVALIITRFQNTLKSTLEQIINSNVFSDIEDTESFKKLIEANHILNEEELREQIAALLVAECNVKDEEGDKYLKRRHRRFLHSFLTDEVIRENILFKENGPIERIMSKLVHNPKIDNQNIEPRFYPEDFNIVHGGETLRKMNMRGEQSADRAIRMAESLANEKTWPTLREDVSRYLNSKIDRVIQSSIKIGKSDLREIFNQIRTKLKEDNKSLTLFIEDITAFTGIDRELIEILLINHRNEKNLDLCRITSVVGITTEYYNDYFPDNVKDRVTNKVIIEDESLFTSEEDKCELIGRYINAAKSEPRELEDWLKDGAVDSDLPIKSSSTDFEWADFTLGDGRKLSLYPFNKKAITNIYNGIRTQSPRNFIETIMLNLFKDYIIKPDEFPPTEQDLSNIEFPRWKDALIEERLMEEVEEDKRGRVNTLLKLWGDADIYKEEIEGRVYIGGVEKEVFEQFNLPLIDGARKQVGKDSVDERKLNKSIGELEDRTQQAAQSRNVKELEKIIEELEQWREGGVLASHKWFRDSLCNMIRKYFNWEEESISPLFMRYFIVSNNFDIEGQSVGTGEGFLMERDTDSYYVLLALALWRYKGNRSWDFPNSEEYILILTNYLNKNKEGILDIARYPDIEDKENWDYEKWALQQEYYICMLNGELDVDQSLEEIYKVIFTSNINIDIKNSYGEVWNSIINRLKSDRDIENHHNQIKRYYNLILGNANPETTSVYYLDAYHILNNLEKLKKDNWKLDNDVIDFLYKDRINNHYLPLKLLKRYWAGRIDKLADEGNEKIQSHLEKMENYFGENYNEENIDELNRMAKKFLDEILLGIKENYDPELFRPFKDRKYKGKDIMDFVEEMKGIKDLDNVYKIIKLSQESIFDMDYYLKTLENLEIRVISTENRYRDRIKEEDKKLISQITEIEENINNTIGKMKKELSSLIEVDSYVGG